MDDLARTSTIATPDGPEAALKSLAREGERGRLLRAQLASRFPGRSEGEIEDAVQTACHSFLAEAEGISEPGHIYAWIRTAAYHALLRELEHQGWERAVDPAELGRSEFLAEEAGPAEELIALENEAELEALVREVADSLSDRRQTTFSLWGAGHSRREIAARLGLSERAVKRDLLAIMEEARIVLAREVGGGCLVGEPLVLRFAYGLATTAEAAQARLHLDRCRRCSGLVERLEAWREKAGAVLPVPAAEAASPGLIERVVSHGAHAVGSVKQQILGGTDVGRQAAVGAYARAVDPGPLAGIRPGAVAALVAGCIAVGGGATYCAEQGVDPLGAAKSLIAGTQESEQSSSPPPAATEPVTATPPPTSEESPPESTATAPAAEPTYAPEPQPKAEPEPAPEPEASFEPSAPVSPSSEEVVAEPATESAPVVKPSPAPAPSRNAPQFGGP